MLSLVHQKRVKISSKIACWECSLEILNVGNVKQIIFWVMNCMLRCVLVIMIFVRTIMVFKSKK